MPVIQQAERAILLTGTPALARPKELFNQITALLPAAKLKMKDYGERYCAGGNSKFDKYCGAQPGMVDNPHTGAHVYSQWRICFLYRPVQALQMLTAVQLAASHSGPCGCKQTLNSDMILSYVAASRPSFVVVFEQSCCKQAYNCNNN